jgi:nitrogen fixation protein FixH
MQTFSQIEGTWRAQISAHLTQKVIREQVQEQEHGGRQKPQAGFMCSARRPVQRLDTNALTGHVSRPGLWNDCRRAGGEWAKNEDANANTVPDRLTCPADQSAGM